MVNLTQTVVPPTHSKDEMVLLTFSSSGPVSKAFNAFISKLVDTSIPVEIHRYNEEDLENLTIPQIYRNQVQSVPAFITIPMVSWNKKTLDVVVTKFGFTGTIADFISLIKDNLELVRQGIKGQSLERLMTSMKSKDYQNFEEIFRKKLGCQTQGSCDRVDDRHSFPS